MNFSALGAIEMSRAGQREQDVDAPEELPDWRISKYPNHVTNEGMEQLELMLETAREAHSAAIQAHDRSALPPWCSVNCAIGVPGARALVSFLALSMRRR